LVRVLAIRDVSVPQFTNRPIGATIHQMGEHDAAQALIFIRALCELLDKMTRQLSWVEHHGSQLEAAALRRDIHEALTHINRLRSKYLDADEPTPARQLARQAR
jgi:hypothetical protein